MYYIYSYCILLSVTSLLEFILSILYFSGKPESFQPLYVVISLRNILVYLMKLNKQVIIIMTIILQLVIHHHWPLIMMNFPMRIILLKIQLVMISFITPGIELPQSIRKFSVQYFIVFLMIMVITFY
jgi:hypothetical protein